ncbi:MFS transporter [Spirosoma agri]|uniref:MFS transporter n=2 Tax=Spirosoma agri TaxID=1987381 RepID=A0A6M0IQE5_9BACT|nr:MFS transporter [Spirosoma agri]
MAITCGLTAANLYYNQPLLVTIGRSFQVSDHWASLLATAPQVGYTLGMLLLVPLGDRLERKRLIVGLSLGAVACLILSATAPSYGVLLGVSVLLGGCSAVPQLVLPMAVQLTHPAERGRIIGRIMSGLLLGILLSRTVSGYLGAQLGWRTVYAGAAGVGLVLTGLLSWKLPTNPPAFLGSYAALMRSLAVLVRELPLLRRSALVGGSIFGAFSVFWTTLVFYLESPAYQYGSAVAGSFGLVGALGALVAPLAGTWVDKYGSDKVITFGIGLTLLAYLVLGCAGSLLAGLIVGVILLDSGVQAAHVANQTLIFSLRPEARSRLNTVYMTGYFAGGSVGSVLGGLAWTHGGWTGVCAVGASCLILALVLHRSLGNQTRI